MFTPVRSPIPAKTLLNVDYYRNLLNYDIAGFFNVAEQNNFDTALRSELSGLLKESEKRIWSAEAKDRALLFARLLVAMDLPDETTDWLMREYPTTENHQEYILTAEQRKVLLQLDPFPNGDKRHYIRVHDAKSNWTKFEKISNICAVMKMHKQVVALIEGTPVLNAGLNLINPNQVQTVSSSVPVLGLYEPPAADNNSN